MRAIMRCWTLLGAASRRLWAPVTSYTVAEQLYSVLESFFSSKQNTSLQDYISLSVMLQHNIKIDR